MAENSIINDHFIFRIILQAMSHPGKIYPLSGFSGPRPDVVMLLGCLMDNAVGFAVIGDTELEAAIGRHTDSRPVSLETADYIVVCNGNTSGRLAGFKRGCLAYPDTGATVLYLVKELSESKGELVLSGPGVNGSAALRITGIDTEDLLLLSEVNREFPLGVDAIFLDQAGSIACIPRSSRIGVNS